MAPAGDTGGNFVRSLALAHEAMVCDRLGSAPEVAQAYLDAAGELNEAASRCPLAPTAAQTATKLAKAAEQLAGAASSGNLAKAALLYRRAASKLDEATDICPDGHPNRLALEEHAAEINVRVIYLESLHGCVATIAVEDHIGEIHLEREYMKDSHARSAAYSPGAAPSAASSSVPDSVALRPQAAQSLGGSVDSPGLDADAQVPGKADWLQEAAKLEIRARAFEDQAMRSEALQAYKDCLHIYDFVQRRDGRARNPKIKQMIRERMEELLTRAEAIKAYQVLNS